MSDKIAQQWAQDVDDYGELAYLMWERRVHNATSIGLSTHQEYIAIESNFYINEYGFDGAMTFQRKPSAALPFSLERAKAGDVVEAMDGVTGEWHTLEAGGKWWAWMAKKLGWPDKNKKNFNYFCGKHRMKYPPKV